MMKRLVAVLVLGQVLLLLPTMAGSSVASLPAHLSAAEQRVLADMRNSDIKWHGSYLGLWPEIQSPTIRKLGKRRPHVDNALLCALADERRFAIAHVLLQMRHEVTWPPGDTAEQWNGLRVQLQNVTTLDGNDLGSLQEAWLRALGVNGLTCQ